MSGIRGRRQHSGFSTSVVQRLHLVYFVCMHSTQEVVHHGNQVRANVYILGRSTVRAHSHSMEQPHYVDRPGKTS